MQTFYFTIFNWSERLDLNQRPLPPQGSALAKLSYAPTTKKLYLFFVEVSTLFK